MNIHYVLVLIFEWKEKCFYETAQYKVWTTLDSGGVVSRLIATKEFKKFITSDMYLSFLMEKEWY